MFRVSDLVVSKLSRDFSRGLPQMKSLLADYSFSFVIIYKRLQTPFSIENIQLPLDIDFFLISFKTWR